LALKVTQLEAKNAQLEVKIGKLEAKVEQQDSFLTSLLREKRTAAATDSIPIGNNQSAVAINGLPSSCVDLKMIGHTLSGIYSVMGSAKMESVFCDFIKLPDDAGKCFVISRINQLQLSFFFNSIGFQKFIGYADVKSTPVYFYVQRNTSFYDEYTPIPFQLARVNVGNAMNLTSGIFTAPRPGIYFFSFAVTASLLSSDSTVYSSILYLNGDIIGSTGVLEIIGPVDQDTPMSFPSTLNLKTGDQIWVQTTSSDGAYIQDGDLHNIHFTGFMLEEEIVASL
jgi:hypothetical protein